jgi:hypothetical protein
MNPNPAIELAAQHTSLDGISPRLIPSLQIAGGAALAVGFGLGLARGDHFQYFFHAYLTSFAYVLGMVVGSLLLVLLLHVSRAGWGVAVRRLAEVLAGNVPLMLVLFLPVVVPVVWGNSTLYTWADPRGTAHEELSPHKSWYYAPAFFALRAAGYFLVWWLIARFFLDRSVQQDGSGDPRLTVSMERASGPAILALGLTVTFASFDWLMSLDAQWTSSIYGIYYFSGAVVGAVALLILAAMALQATGRLTGVITVEHYHDLGKILFAAVVFWGYIAFSQYLLIWYANVPEETVWYGARQAGPWVYVSLALVAGHLFVPFFGLLSRSAKRCKAILAFWAVWLLVFHWLDVYWLVMPSLELPGLPLGPIDVCLAVSLTCLYWAGALRLAVDRSLVPLRDPRLAESLAFENF